MTGADLLVASLYEHGVRVIFGMPGSHTTGIYDAIERHGHIRTILTRNEQAGAFAADGYARVTGQPGVICTTAGPGATNALTGIGEAWGDTVPVLLVSGQTSHDRLHEECGNYHEIDLESIFRPCTKYAGTVMDNAQIPDMVARAFNAMTVGRRRPAALFAPLDLMGDLVGAPNPVRGRVAPPVAEPDPLRGSARQFAEAADLLTRARRPILLAGGGAVWANAGPELRALAERLNCPVLTTQNGKGILDERDPLSLGHARSFRARAGLPHADAMLAVGCRFTEVFTYFRTLRIPETLIQIDIDPTQIGMNYPVKIGIEADAKLALQSLLERTSHAPRDGWASLWPAARAATNPHPEWLIETLRAELPDDAVLFTDASEMAYRIQMDYPAYAPRTSFYPSNYITLGWGFPAAIGAAVALPDRAVVSFSGDGGFVMTCQELATAARYNLRMIIIVHNDNAYGAIKHLQRLKYDARYRDTDLNNPDFPALASAFGVPSRRAADAPSFALALREALARQGPSLIEVPDAWRYLRY